MSTTLINVTPDKTPGGISYDQAIIRLRDAIAQLASNSDNIPIVPLPAIVAPNPVASASVLGVNTTHFMRADAQPAGVHSVSKNGSGQLLGDVLLAAADSSITVSQSGQTVSFALGTLPFTFLGPYYSQFAGTNLTLVPTQHGDLSAFANYTGFNRDVVCNGSDVFNAGGTSVTLATGTTAAWISAWDGGKYVHWRIGLT